MPLTPQTAVASTIHGGYAAIPDQFEIIWTTDRGGDGMLEDLKLPHSRYDAPVVNGKGVYTRMIIGRRSARRRACGRCRRPPAARPQDRDSL